MSAEWFLVNDGKEQGPFTAKQLKELANSGSLERTQLLRRADKKKIVRAEKVAGLFTASPSNDASPSNKASDQATIKRPPPPPSRLGLGAATATQPAASTSAIQQPPTPPSSNGGKPATTTSAPGKQSRLNPNTTFVLGLWAGLGLCAAAFTFLAITGRFAPLVAWLEAAGKKAEKQQGEANHEPAATSVKKDVTRVNGSKKGRAGLSKDFFPVVIGKSKVYRKRIFAADGEVIIEVVSEETGQPDGSIKIKEISSLLPGDTTEFNVSGDAGLIAIGPHFEDELEQSKLVRLEDEKKSSTGKGHGRRAVLEKTELLTESDGKKVRYRHAWFLEEDLGLVYERSWNSANVLSEKRLIAVIDADGQSVSFAPIDDLVASVSKGPGMAHVEPQHGSEAASPPTPQSNALPKIPGARSLRATVGTAGIDEMPWWFKTVFNVSLKNVKCYATDNSLTIDFDVDDAPWRKLGNKPFAMAPLLVRLFDKNGNYLTHFKTSEGFTASKPVFDFNNNQYERALPEQRDRYILKPVLLTTTGNRLAYSVNVRDLRDAAIVEVGFTEHK